MSESITYGYESIGRLVYLPTYLTYLRYLN